MTVTEQLGGTSGDSRGNATTPRLLSPRRRAACFMLEAAAASFISWAWRPHTPTTTMPYATARPRTATRSRA